MRHHQPRCSCAASLKLRSCRRRRRRTSRRRWILISTWTRTRHPQQSAIGTPISPRVRQLGHGSRGVTCCHLPPYPFSSLLPCSLSSREHTQDSSYVLPELVRPLHPLRIAPTSSHFPQVEAAPEASSFVPVIYVSALRAVDTGTERQLSAT